MGQELAWTLAKIVSTRIRSLTGAASCRESTKPATPQQIPRRFVTHWNSMLWFYQPLLCGMSMQLRVAIEVRAEIFASAKNPEPIAGRRLLS